MVTKHVTENPKGNPLANYQFSCTLLRADLSEIEITLISYTNKHSYSTLGLLFVFPTCKVRLSYTYARTTLGDLLFKKLKMKDLKS